MHTTATRTGDAKAGKARPRVFISYSWTSEAYQAEVVELAERLVRDGVDVAIDVWDLLPGHDKYAFMERCVTDETIDRVLILCDRAYAQKANGRRGGVGDETTVITAEVYGSVQQEKFIPIVMERGEDGAPFLPAYLASRMYIDLSDSAHEGQYEDLLRAIFGVRKWPRPKPGEPPSWLFGKNVTPAKELRHQGETPGEALTRRPVVAASTSEMATRRLSDYSWPELKEIANRIAAAESDFEGLQIAMRHGLTDAHGRLQGETKPLELTDGTTATVRILGFRHDRLADGTARKAGISFEFADVPLEREMNMQRTNAGGWAESDMRQFLRTDFLYLLPDELRVHIAKVRKRTNNRGYVGANDPSAVSATDELLWLLALSEVYGTLSVQSENVPEYPVVYDAEGAQYQLYAEHGVSANNYDFCRKSGASSWWWLRSPGAYGPEGFRNVGPQGAWYGDSAYYTRGVSPAFCL